MQMLDASAADFAENFDRVVNARRESADNVSRDVADGDLRMVRGEQIVKPGWADRFHDAMRKKKAAKKG